MRIHTDTNLIFNVDVLVCINHSYRNLPIKGASTNKGAPYSLGELSLIIADQNKHSFFAVY